MAWLKSHWWLVAVVSTLIGLGVAWGQVKEKVDKVPKIEQAVGILTDLHKQQAAREDEKTRIRECVERAKTEGRDPAGCYQ